jgi:hypothetical protein
MSLLLLLLLLLLFIVIVIVIESVSVTESAGIITSAITDVFSIVQKSSRPVCPTPPTH